jgi:anti-sigma B factor antagonist
VATPIDKGCNQATREILVIDLEWLDGAALVQPRGELDLASAPLLRAVLDGLVMPRSLVLDMRGLSFIDSTGLHLLTELHGRAMREGFELQLVAPRAPADRPIRMCGLDLHLPFVPDLPANGLAA